MDQKFITERAATDLFYQAISRVATGKTGRDAEHQCSISSIISLREPLPLWTQRAHSKVMIRLNSWRSDRTVETTLATGHRLESNWNRSKELITSALTNKNMLLIISRLCHILPINPPEYYMLEILINTSLTVSIRAEHCLCEGRIYGRAVVINHIRLCECT